jgi:flagellar hook-associated protein 3 FlgL
MDADRRAIGHAREMLSNADTAIGDATGVLQSARDALLSAGTSTLSPKDRANVAVQLRQMREELVSVANRGDGQGGFVFGGQGTPVAPFSPDGSAYNAPAGTMKLGQTFASEVSFDGSEHFTAVASPGGPENIFSKLDAVIATLENPAILDQLAQNN